MNEVRAHKKSFLKGARQVRGFLFAEYCCVNEANHQENYERN